MDILDTISELTEFVRGVVKRIKRLEGDKKKIKKVIIHSKERIIERLEGSIVEFIGFLGNAMKEGVITSSEAKEMVAYYRTKTEEYLNALLHRLDVIFPTDNTSYFNRIIELFEISVEEIPEFSRKKWFKQDGTFSLKEAMRLIRESFGGKILVSCDKDELFRFLEKRRIAAERIGIRFEYEIIPKNGNVVELEFKLHENAFIKEIKE